jgi:trans-2,3-dihydro-3-hydroxyanthranilate isomerase
MARRLVWVDVFAARPLAGNPLAVVLDATGLDADRMQAIATELGLSETVFVLPPENRAAARLRIFTPVHELPMAGHPVVGAAWVLHREGRLPEAATVETGVGPLAVSADADGARMEQARPEAGPLVDPEPVARALGVRVAPDPAQVWSTGIPLLMLPAADSGELARARPDHHRLAELSAAGGWLGVSLYSAEASGPGAAEVRVRFFAPGEGVSEDPATGSAAGCLGACLAAAGMGDGEGLRMTVTQGVEMARPSEIHVLVDAPGGRPARVQVSGRVHLVMEGTLAIP